MRSPTRSLLHAGLGLFGLVAGFLTPSVAHAGGIGLVGTGGFHFDRLYYYKQNELGKYDQQTPVDQMNSDFGGGLEILLGDKDNKVLGMFRLYYVQDAPQSDPASAADYTFKVRKDPRSIGMIDAGLSFGVLGEPDKLQGTVVGFLGSGFFTSDQTEFVQAQLGVGGTYMIARHLQASVQVTGGSRYLKRLYPIAQGSGSIRYLFD